METEGTLEQVGDQFPLLVGKRDRKMLDGFLKKHYQQMPRTMLRYAIERHPERIRKQYLAGTI